MPTRMLRDWTDSERVDQLSPGAETLFVRLLMKVDDFGRFVAKPRLLCASCFPLKPNLTEKQIACWCDELAKAGLIRLYQDQGKRYLEVSRFDQRLRAKHSRYPAPPASNVPDTCPTHAGHMPDTCPPDLDLDLDLDLETENPLTPPLPETVKSKKRRKATNDEHDAAVKALVEPLTEPWKAKLIEHCDERKRLKHPHTERSLRTFIADLLTWPAGMAATGLDMAIKRQWRIAERAWVEKELGTPPAPAHEPPVFSKRYEQLFGGKIGRPT